MNRKQKRRKMRWGKEVRGKGGDGRRPQKATAHSGLAKLIQRFILMFPHSRINIILYFLSRLRQRKLPYELILLFIEILLISAQRAATVETTVRSRAYENSNIPGL